MAKLEIKKLIRSGKAELFSKSNIKITYKTLSEKQFLFALQDKITEEIKEAIEFFAMENYEKTLQELADALEALQILAVACNSSIEEIEKIRQTKEKTHGKYESQYFLDSIDIN